MNEWSLAHILVGAAGLLGSLTVHAALPSDVTFTPFYDTTQISFLQPTHVGQVPGDVNRMVVVERPGRVSLLEKTGATYTRRDWFSVNADTSTHWDGAWDVAFHPQFPAKPLFYFLYRQPTGPRSSVIEEWQVDGPDLANPRKVRTILAFPQKEIHSSGDMEFGPDGYLYTSQGDRQQSGQDKNQLWGKVSRIDVDHQDPGKEYAVPADNPFIGQSAYSPEIWAMGFRVPWRFSFDAKTGDLYLGDVGDAVSDELNIVEKGKNYGAGVVEGECELNDCSPYVEPVWAMTRTEGGCIIGGHVYRADSNSVFYGAYIFADYQEQWLWGAVLNPQKNGLTEKKKLLDKNAKTPGRISALGEDAAGNLYAAFYRETGANRQTHIFKLTHPQLRPATTSLSPSARRSRRLLLRMSRAMLPGYRLDGRRLPGIHRKTGSTSPASPGRGGRFAR